ncbi:peptidoglycan-binding protein [Lottiidibacillus patelloidae]|uniref:Peptidoglycan-binding protein n=1 Tax=Lottiidibacillus patelloidae TaxID=2670334 RepID=A0A263BW08_9BACI|nr:cell wall hydrolase [Lottiidibacillus patelloidae]OZM57507.1 peptidoglycan-binding protein [Lottiidibacillus patelloidae]
MKHLLIVVVATLVINPLNTFAGANYEVKQGDSLWAISKHFGISLNALRQANNKYDNLIYPGQSLIIPATITNEEKELLARLVRAEAVGEPFAGKVAVATVVLNRVDSDLFPDTIKEVIYEVSPGGYYAFSPVQNGQINKAADADSYKAVEEALAFRGQGQGSIYFYNPVTAKSDWILSRQVTIQIGNHVFAK